MLRRGFRILAATLLLSGYLLSPAAANDTAPPVDCEKTMPSSAFFSRTGQVLPTLWANQLSQVAPGQGCAGNLIQRLGSVKKFLARLSREPGLMLCRDGARLRTLNHQEKTRFGRTKLPE